MTLKVRWTMCRELFLVRGGLRISGEVEGDVKGVREGRRRAVTPATVMGRVREHEGFEIFMEAFMGTEGSCKRGMNLWHAVGRTRGTRTWKEGRRDEGMDDTVRYGDEGLQRVSGRGRTVAVLFWMITRGDLREVVRTQAVEEDWKRSSRERINGRTSIMSWLDCGGG